MTTHFFGFQIDGLRAIVIGVWLCAFFLWRIASVTTREIRQISNDLRTQLVEIRGALKEIEKEMVLQGVDEIREDVTRLRKHFLTENPDDSQRHPPTAKDLPNG